MIHLSIWYAENYLEGIEINQADPKQVMHFNSSPRHFADHIISLIFLNENVRIAIQMSLKCVTRVQLTKKSTFVQVMVCSRTGHKYLPEPMLAQFTDAFMRHQIS